jgi:hypothetical protein
MQGRERRLLLWTEPFDSGLWTSFVALWTPSSPTPSRTTIYLFRRAGVRQSGFPGMSFLSSLLMHGAAIFLLVRFPYMLYASPARRVATVASLEQNEIIYYLPKVQRTEALPRVTPPGKGGRPGRGSRPKTEPKAEPKAGSTLFRSDLTVISNAIHPDNARQTIVQPSSPPDLIIKQDLKLPNVMLGNPLPQPARPQFPLAPMKPNQPIQVNSDVAAPQVAAAVPAPLAGLAQAPQRPSLPIAPLAAPKANPNAPASAMSAPQAAASVGAVPVPFSASVTKPQLPVAPLAAPRANPNGSTGAGASMEAPQTQASVGALPASFAGTAGPPQLPGAALAPIRSNSSSASGSARGGSNAGGGGNPGDPNGLLIVGIDPAAAGASISLPPGNRYGGFSISPAGGGPGSPGGSPARTNGAGTGEAGEGGDESTGVGRGESGGAGGGNAGGGLLSVSGPATVAGANASIGAMLASGAVYPVITPPKVRRNSLIISAGATGGGGLGVYHALNCGKIYTMFVPMPTGNWILQYCQPNASKPDANPTTNTRVVQLQEGLVPPDPVEKFDFQRPAVPADKSRGMLVIKGLVREDGVVENLEIFRGVFKELDEMALLALTQWKFHPARQGAKAVAVQILLGIQLSPAATR